MLKHLVITLNLICLSISCFGQFVEWQPMHAPVDVTVLSFVQLENEALYAGTATHGIYRYNGSTWESINKGLTSMELITLDGTSASTLFAGTVEGIYQFNPEDESWMYKETGETVSCFTFNSNGDIFAGGRGKIFRSTDQGESWVSFPIEGVNELFQIEHIEVTTNGVLFAHVSFTMETFRSLDNGESWQLIQTERPVTSFASDSQGKIYAAIDGGGIEVSTDNGLTWQKVSDEFDGIRQALMFIDSNDVMYVGDLYGNIFQVVLDSNTVSSLNHSFQPDQVLSILNNNLNQLYIGTADSGVYRTENLGLDWNQLNAGFPLSRAGFLFTDRNNQVFSGSFPKGLFKYSFTSQQWKYLTFGGSGNYQFTTNSNNQIFISFVTGFYASAGLIRSDDEGETWQDIAQSLPGYPVGIPIINGLVSDNEDKLYLSLSSGEIYRSDDQGDTWLKTEINFGIDYDILSLAGSGNNMLYAGSHEGVLFRSLDGAVTWSQIQTGITHDIREIIVDAHGGVYVLSSFGDEVLYSSDQGESWTELNISNLETTVNTLICGSGNDVYIATNGKGVLRSVDQGLNWTPLNQNLSDLSVVALTKTSDDYLFCSTSEQGIFRSEAPLSTGIVDDRFPKDTCQDMIQRIYPNPVSDKTTIRFAVNPANHVKLAVYDYTGAEKLVIVNEFQPNGGYQAEIDMSLWKNGIYFVRMETSNRTLFEKLIVLH